MVTKETILKNYEDPTHPTAFGGVATVARFYNIGKKRARVYLQELDSYVMHKEYRKPKAYNPYYIFKKRALIQADLIFMRGAVDKETDEYGEKKKTKRNEYILPADNDGVVYLCTIIDVFTRKLWVYPLKNHNDNTMVAMWSQFLDHDVGPEKPKVISTDNGTEFTSRRVREVYRRHGVEWQDAYHTSKAAYVERVNKTLQVLLYKYMDAKQKFRYIDALPDIVASYNNRGHRGLEYMTPNEAEDPANQTKVLAIAKRRIGKVKEEEPAADLKVGDTVRLKIDHKARPLLPERRAYIAQYTGEYFKIWKINTKHPIPLYYLQSKNTYQKIKGGMYREYLSKVRGDIYKIDEKIRSRGRGRNLQWLIKWKHFSPRHNSWVKQSDIHDI